jgi:hypothetical protein
MGPGRLASAGGHRNVTRPAPPAGEAKAKWLGQVSVLLVSFSMVMVNIMMSRKRMRTASVTASMTDRPC